MANLSFWADASQLGLADGVSVASWTDYSGLGNHATQATAGFRPVFKTAQVNGLPVVQFDGVSHYLDFSTAISLQPATVCLVGKYLSASNAPYLGDDTAANFMGYYSNTVYYYTTAASLSVARAFPTSAFELYCAVVNAAGGAIDLRFNAASVTSNPSITMGSVSFTHIGRRAAERVNAQIAEIVTYSRALGASEVTTLETYLKGKYNLP